MMLSKWIIWKIIISIMVLGVLVCCDLRAATDDLNVVHVYGVAINKYIEGGRERFYPCYSSSVVNVRILYPYEKGQSIQWETPSFSSRTGKTYIDIPIGFGTNWIRQEMKQDYILSIDGKPYVTFSCTKEKQQTWEGNDGVRLAYYALFRDEHGEFHGRMLLELPPGFYRSESYLTLKVSPAAGSAGNAWFMLHVGALYAGNDMAEWIKKRNF